MLQYAHDLGLTSIILSSNFKFPHYYYIAAYHSLKNIGHVGKDSLIFVDGASGGVCMATIELAKAMGAKVIAGVR